MRRIGIGLPLALGLLATEPLVALPVQNPSDASMLEQGIFIDPCLPLYFCRFPQFGNFQFGYYGDFVFNRKMQTEINQTVHETRIFTQAGYLALDFFDLIEVFGTLGVSRLNFSGDQVILLGDTALAHNMLNLFSSDKFSWSVGVEITLLEANCWALGVSGQYFDAGPYANFYLRDNGATTPPIYYNDETFRYQEAQGSAALSYQINLSSTCSALIPYVGISYSYARLKTEDIYVTVGETRHELLDFKQQRDLGYAVGATLLANGKGAVTAEVRFLSENAFHVNMKLRF